MWARRFFFDEIDQIYGHDFYNLGHPTDNPLITIQILVTGENGKGLKPSAIVYYRDGLGEGQYNDVLKFEISEIRKACTEIEADYQPGITMLSVQRRHHTKYLFKCTFQ